MYGAIIGDIVGSRFEFNNYRHKNFELFTKENFFTDDTVMTCAVADALINKKNIKKNLQEYGRMFPGRGYGGMFSRWIHSEHPEPYWSFGNGAAMRISPVGWIANDEKEVKKLSKKVTEVTHNHPEGIKGAEVTAMCIFYARQGQSKEQIMAYAEKKYPQIKNMDYKELKLHYYFNETCQNTVPQAIYCFYISHDYEDCIRTAISIGGDSDTIAAIAGSIAEAYWGIPEKFKKGIERYFDKNDKKFLLEPIEKIYNKL